MSKVFSVPLKIHWQIFNLAVVVFFVSQIYKTNGQLDSKFQGICTSKYLIQTSAFVVGCLMQETANQFDTEGSDSS